MSYSISKSNKINRSSIRRSTDDDLKAIHKWIIEEDTRDVQGNFLCNWRLTKESHEDGDLIVYVDGKAKIPVAYQWGSLLCSGILQVKEDFRGKKIGSKMVKHRIKQAYKKDECILNIQCEPPSSIPFWEKMGFVIYTEKYKKYGYQILEKKLPLPDDGKSVNVIIRFFPEDRKWSDELILPLECFSPLSVKTDDNVIHLGKRVSFFEYIYSRNTGRDVVVEIEVDGNIIYSDKAKYKEAEYRGIKRCRNGFYIDKIQPCRLG
jgi:GNAT superfamily N-acetyltransferase